MKDKAKTFMFVGIGALALMIAFQLGASWSRADTHPVGVIHALGQNIVLGIDGGYWSVGPHVGDEWHSEPALEIPVPVSDVVMWQNTCFVTREGDYWHYSDDVDGYVNFGHPPIDPSDAPEQINNSISTVKSSFKK